MSGSGMNIVDLEEAHNGLGSETSMKDSLTNMSAYVYYVVSVA